VRIRKQSRENGNKYFACGIYQSTYPDCGMNYGGQRSKILRQVLKNTTLFKTIVGF